MSSISPLAPGDKFQEKLKNQLLDIRKYKEDLKQFINQTYLMTSLEQGKQENTLQLPFEVNQTEFDDYIQKEEKELGLDFSDEQLPYRLYVITQIRSALIEEITQQLNQEDSSMKNNLQENQQLLDMIRNKVIPDKHENLLKKVIKEANQKEKYQLNDNNFIKELKNKENQGNLGLILKNAYKKQNDSKVINLKLPSIQKMKEIQENHYQKQKKQKQ